MNRLAYIFIVAIFSPAAPAFALDDAHRDKARQVFVKSFDYLRAQQNPDGAWLPDPGPAVTGLVLAGMLRDETIDRSDPAIRKAVAYILSRQKESGGIYDTLLENYNTSVCLMALGPLRDDPNFPQVPAAIEKAQNYLRGLQWSNQPDPTGKTLDQEHPFYGGAGYGKHGRPDLSNTAMMIAGLRDSGLDCKDPAYQRALTFITRLQGSKANTAYGDQITNDGGFIYATSVNKENIGVLQSYADPPTEIDSAGRSRLRTYGSMTYAGFMSYLYAQLDRDDPRVQDALDFIRRNYTLDENPRTGMQGYYYYLHLFSRAMSAYTRGEPLESRDPASRDATTVTTADGKTHDWANELIDKLGTLQRPDGSFINDTDRWMEGDPVLATAYAALALQHALGR